MQRAGLLIGRGAFVAILLMMMALLAACVDQGTGPTEPPPAAEEGAEGEATAVEGEEGATAEGEAGAEVDATTGVTETATMEEADPSMQQEQITIGTGGELSPSELTVDPGTSIGLSMANLSDSDATVTVGAGSASVGLQLPAATMEGNEVTFVRQTVLLRYDEEGTYEISCPDESCSGSVTVTVGAGEAEATPEADATEEGATPEADATPEEGATPEADATPEEGTTDGVIVVPGSEDADLNITTVPEEAVTEEAATEEEAEPTEEATPEEEAAPTEEATPEEEADAGEAAVSGDAAAGEELFQQTLIQTSSGVAAGCVTCHYVQADLGDFTGPNLANFGNVAGERVDGSSAAEYAHDSIVNTNDYIVDGFAVGIMPQNYGDILSEDEVNNLVAYLLTLEG